MGRFLLYVESDSGSGGCLPWPCLCITFPVGSYFADRCVAYIEWLYGAFSVVYASASQSTLSLSIFWRVPFFFSVALIGGLYISSSIYLNHICGDFPHYLGIFNLVGTFVKSLHILSWIFISRGTDSLEGWFYFHISFSLWLHSTLGVYQLYIVYPCLSWCTFINS